LFEELLCPQGLESGMLYDAYQAQQDMLAPFRAGADLARAAFGDTSLGPHANCWFRTLAAGAEILFRSQLIHQRPAYGIDTVLVEGEPVAVTEEVALAMPFGDLVHFRKAANVSQPRVLLAAPMAGHGAAQLRETVAGLLPQFDVHVTDWRDAREVPLSAGGFGLDDYIDYLLRFIAEVGPGAHLVAICQSCVPALAALSLLAEDAHPAQPLSLTMMAGPIDAALSPSPVNAYATGAPLSWFEQQLISTVPAGAPGAGRRVYGGAMQIISWAGMEHRRHMASLSSSLFDPSRYWQAMLEIGSAMLPQQPVLDLAAEFYLDNLREVFQRCALARGSLLHRGRPVRPQAICHVALLTVEGSQDEICGAGQTAAAHALCSGIDAGRKRHVVAQGARHRDVFSGECWRTQVLPEVLKTLKLAGR
jgi:poly(3-hydroxybutyrate) depolymerase